MKFFKAKKLKVEEESSCTKKKHRAGEKMRKFSVFFLTAILFVSVFGVLLT
jgi:hypothetical protein